VTIAQHALEVTTGNWQAHIVAAFGYGERNDFEGFVRHLEEADRLMPGKVTSILEEVKHDPRYQAMQAGETTK
jgi:hypothetical protein